ncbi:MAG: hypothetical protein KME56_08295 [Candidatus Thiodiazotropha sp. (ex Ctena orbiculata)]|nr:hypothetical protein [Candidatus Thiodiazotropha taylori]MBT2996617.1 hypothetical protein [Candidatus Thiodiazotropha taylori]MBT3000657.1 hypothetical protein [Candidatus Thiodiazotropha taylori]MBV2106986.1 hypothetical protein [Candidatus Thiodiazotropha taylori]MBV2111076.1 hypothetical protein [Candidatus Thiodiazotropha taylori]
MQKKTGLYLLSSAFCVAITTPDSAFAERARDIIGKWQQSHVEFAGNRIKDDSQSWEFMKNGTVRFVKSRPVIDKSGGYSCEGDIIYMKGRLPGRLKILAYDGGTMALESLDHGGGIAHVVKIK